MGKGDKVAAGAEGGGRISQVVHSEEWCEGGLRLRDKGSGAQGT